VIIVAVPAWLARRLNQNEKSRALTRKNTFWPGNLKENKLDNEVVTPQFLIRKTSEVYDLGGRMEKIGRAAQFCKI
jgi:hypothetical protein